VAVSLSAEPMTCFRLHSLTAGSVRGGEENQMM